MVTNIFFVISFLPTLCSHFKVGRRFAECSAEYYIRESQNVPQKVRRMFQENSKDVPQNTILGREDWVIFTWKLHHLFITNTNLFFKYLFYSNTYFLKFKYLFLFKYLFYSNTYLFSNIYFIQILILFKYLFLFIIQIPILIYYSNS